MVHPSKHFIYAHYSEASLSDAAAAIGHEACHSNSWWRHSPELGNGESKVPRKAKRVSRFLILEACKQSNSEIITAAELATSG